MAEENTPNTPRPIGIKPITIKPIQPAQRPSVAEPPKTDETPAKPQPPVAETPVAETPKEDASPGSPAKPISITPNRMAGKPLSSATSAPTIRLKPVVQSPAGEAPRSVSPPAQSMRPQTIQPPSIKQSTHASLDSASKSKTSRISLDSAFSDAGGSPKIHIGPSSTAPVGKITSNLTADSLGLAKGQTAKINLPLSTTDGDVTRRRTLRVKASSTSPATEKSADGAPLTEAPTVRKKKAIVLKKDAVATAQESGVGDQGEEAHVSAFSAFQSQPVAKTNPIFPVVAVAAIFMIITLTVLYMSQACGPDRSLTAFSSFPGISAPSWPGQVSTF